MTDRERLAELEESFCVGECGDCDEAKWLLSLVKKQDAKIEKAKDALQLIKQFPPISEIANQALAELEKE